MEKNLNLLEENTSSPIRQFKRNLRIKDKTEFGNDFYNVRALKVERVASKSHDQYVHASSWYTLATSGIYRQGLQGADSFQKHEALYYCLEVDQVEPFPQRGGTGVQKCPFRDGDWFWKISGILPIVWLESHSIEAFVYWATCIHKEPPGVIVALR